MAADDFSGAYDGIAGADGYRLTLTQEGTRVAGQLRPPSGAAYTLNGHRSGDAAQGALLRGQDRLYFHLEARPLGVQFLVIPAGEDGRPQIAEAQELSFLKEGLSLPESARQEERPAPDTAGTLAFIEGFRGWSPADMARLYRGLEARDRDLILLFDHVAAELIWRVCAGNPPHAGFAEPDLDALLDRQNIACEDYLQAVAQARDAGLIDEFVRRVNFQLDILRETVKCGRGDGDAAHCADVGALRAPVVARWRPAKAIMASLARDGVPSGAARAPLSDAEAEEAVSQPLAPPSGAQQDADESGAASAARSVSVARPLARPDVPATAAPGVVLPLPRPR